MASQPEFPPIDFSTLGFLIIDWIEAHCVIPDGFSKGDPFILSGWQAWNILNHYRVKPTAQGVRANQYASAFVHRRSQTVRPQKTGKGPFTSAVVCAEGVGPVLLDGWATGDEVYDCRDWGCGCGFLYFYEPGEPMGTHWPTPLIQITATSEEQTANIYAALRPMIEGGPLAEIIRKTGEEFIRLPNDGRIDTVTSNARSRLGARVTFVPQDETGIWVPSTGMVKVAETQRRGLAGMGGRAWETTNAWDPTENSVAQRTYESGMEDIFIDFPQAPVALSFRNKAERRRILRAVYAGSPWVNLDDIEGEAAELLRVDPQQAERFFGNRLVYAAGTWLPEGRWDETEDAQRSPVDGAFVCLGFDGSENNDWTALRAETSDGWQFTPTYGPDDRPTVWNPAEWGGSIPREEVHAAIDELFTRFNVGRLYADPHDWYSEIGEWSLKYGEKHVMEWATNRPSAMYDSLRRFEVDLASGRLTHDACKIAEIHVANARKKAVPGQKYVLTKPTDHQKIDVAMASALAHEAASDALASGWGKARSRRVLVLS
ncbi:hypothetical protein JOF56_003751 [Kibdelosporangium banguiense]|uniref:Terminase n=1 Tax=Kibdelosporangium banguiense TaxID=1365924 RepID=A0ABS4THR8_9PSEU|nr:hypothetical protein [Kibdelosporangium banguiense]MBP2323366.1 hypothetical protein [Kibdelosporangium banguiense]